MSSLWQAYLPHHVTQQLLQNPQASPIGYEARGTAVILFADVSGFTAISEALSVIGKQGAEELTHLLNSYFEPMIELIQTYGGIIAKFGGDAMTVLFPYTPENGHLVSHQAIQCALLMQEGMGAYAKLTTPMGQFALTMKAGLAAGPVFYSSVGDPQLRLEYIIAGQALDQCAEAEHQASKGQVILHQTVLNLAGESVQVTAVNDHFALVHTLSPPPPTAPLPALPPLSSEIIKTIAVYLHPSLAQRLQEGQSAFLNEHRQVTILFVSFTGFDYDDDPEVGHKLQTYFHAVIHLIHRYDGYLNKVDMGDKGSKYIILFGAPIAHEDDEERALQCSLELHQLLPDNLKIGIHTGFVYCGQVGSAQRQEYTVMGDAVNLAARLMQSAPVGQTLVSQQTYAACSASFIWQSESALRVKGKTEPIHVHTLRGPRLKNALHLQEPQYTLPMVGREQELAQVKTKLDYALQGQGQIIGITAEAGMGKSRFMAEIIYLAQTEMNILAGECHSYGTNTSYFIWQNILRGLFAIDPNWPISQQILQLESALAQIDPALLSRLPLLGSALNIAIPDNDLTLSLSAQLRKASLETLVTDCLRHQAQQKPILLVLEDCHWLDPLSNDLLENVARSLIDIPILLVSIYRTPETEPIQPHIRRFAHFTEIRLTEFTAEETAHLIRLKLLSLFGTAEGDSFTLLVQRIVERSQGNPFYIDEMINLIHDGGLNPTDLQAISNLELPNSLYSLIISRIDQLDELPKTTLKVASVIGRLFKANWLWGIYDQLGTPEQIRAQLAHLSQLDLIPLDKPEPELEYLFKHIITQEVSYQSLALTTRSYLHEQIGHYIEAQYANNLDRHLDLLAYHYGLSTNIAKQRHYFAQVAHIAKSSYANETAITYYRRLQPLLPPAEQPLILLQLGEVLQLIGQWDEAEHLYRQTLTLAKNLQQPLVYAQGLQAMGAFLRTKGVYSEALTWLRQAIEAFTHLQNAQGQADALRETGIIDWQQGNYESALTHFHQCQAIAQTQNDLKGLYKAIGNLGLVSWSQENYDQALTYFQQSYQIAEQLGDRLGLHLVLANIGNIYLEQGDYRGSFNAYFQALQLAIEMGYQQGVSVNIGNIGNIYWYQGHYSFSLSCYLHDLHISFKLGSRFRVTVSTWNVARVLMALEQWEEAGKFLSNAIQLGRLLHIPSELSAFLFEQANLQSAQGHYDLALNALNEAIVLAEQVENESVLFEAKVSQINTLIELKQLSPTIAITQFLEMLSIFDKTEHQMVLHYAIWKLDPNAQTHQSTASELYRAFYEHTPNIEYRSRYFELTGEQLPPPPDLPPLPAVIGNQKTSLQALLTQVEQLLSEIDPDDMEH